MEASRHKANNLWVWTLSDQTKINLQCRVQKKVSVEQKSNLKNRLCTHFLSDFIGSCFFTPSTIGFHGIAPLKSNQEFEKWGEEWKRRRIGSFIDSIFLCIIERRGGRRRRVKESLLEQNFWIIPFEHSVQPIETVGAKDAAAASLFL